MDSIFQQLNSWKVQQVDKKKNLIQFEKNLREDAEYKRKQEQEESERKEFEKRQTLLQLEEQKERDRLEEWTQRQFGMTYNQYEKWDTYLKNRTPEEFERDCYRDPDDYMWTKLNKMLGFGFEL